MDGAVGRHGKQESRVAKTRRRRLRHPRRHRFDDWQHARYGSAGAQNISALGLESDALLMSNGAEGALRINIPIVNQASLVEPFGFVGAGWSRYHVSRSPTNTSSVAGSDDILAVPYGAGLAFGYAGFMADARFTYRSTFYNDLLRTSGSSGRLDSWSAGGQVGFINAWVVIILGVEPGLL